MEASEEITVDSIVKTPIYANQRVEDLPCYHENLTRNQADLLLEHEDEGCYLLRSSSVSPKDEYHKNYSISVRVANTVRHFQIEFNGQSYTFGHGSFLTPLQLWEHLKRAPVLECGDGFVARFEYPYIKEEALFNSGRPTPQYGYVIRHYESDGTCTSLQRSPQSPTQRPLSSINTMVMSTEGPASFKKEGKQWKRRWLILKKNFLTLQKNAREKKKQTNLDLHKAVHIEKVPECKKPNCFKVVFSDGTYYVSADTKRVMEDWYGSIAWQIENIRKRRHSDYS